MFSPVVARTARIHGVDTLSSHECRRNGLSDDVQLSWAASEGRCVVTENYSDFIRLASEYHDRDEAHSGIVLVSRSMSRTVGPLVAALTRLNALYPDGLPPHTILWLEPVS